MASEYLLKKYKDVKPEEPKELTPEEKRKNWLHYHKWHFVVGAVVVALVASFVVEMLQKVEPDFTVAYYGQYYLDFGKEEEMEQLLESLVTDRNGDGKVHVQISSYVINEEDPNAYAQQVALVGDMTVGNSDIFLVADPESAQEQYGLFYQADGTVPEDTERAETVLNYAWSDCPAVSSLDLGMDLYLIRRIYANEEMLAEHAGYEELWEAITAGAK